MVRPTRRERPNPETKRRTRLSQRSKRRTDRTFDDVMASFPGRRRRGKVAATGQSKAGWKGRVMSSFPGYGRRDRSAQ